MTKLMFLAAYSYRNFEWFSSRRGKTIRNLLGKLVLRFVPKNQLRPEHFWKEVFKNVDSSEWIHIVNFINSCEPLASQLFKDIERGCILTCILLDRLEDRYNN